MHESTFSLACTRHHFSHTVTTCASKVDQQADLAASCCCTKDATTQKQCALFFPCIHATTKCRQTLRRYCNRGLNRPEDCVIDFELGLDCCLKASCFCQRVWRIVSAATIEVHEIQLPIFGPARNHLHHVRQGTAESNTRTLAASDKDKNKHDSSAHVLMSNQTACFRWT